MPELLLAHLYTISVRTNLDRLVERYQRNEIDCLCVSLQVQSCVSLNEILCYAMLEQDWSSLNRIVKSAEETAFAQMRFRYNLRFQVTALAREIRDSIVKGDWKLRSEPQICGVNVSVLLNSEAGQIFLFEQMPCSLGQAPCRQLDYNFQDLKTLSKAKCQPREQSSLDEEFSLKSCVRALDDAVKDLNDRPTFVMKTESSSSDLHHWVRAGLMRLNTSLTDPPRKPSSVDLANILMQSVTEAVLASFHKSSSQFPFEEGSFGDRKWGFSDEADSSIRRQGKDEEMLARAVKLRERWTHADDLDRYITVHRGDLFPNLAEFWDIDGHYLAGLGVTKEQLKTERTKTFNDFLKLKINIYNLWHRGKVRDDAFVLGFDDPVVTERYSQCRKLRDYVDSSPEFADLTCDMTTSQKNRMINCLAGAGITPKTLSTLTQDQRVHMQFISKVIVPQPFEAFITGLEC